LSPDPAHKNCALGDFKTREEKMKFRNIRILALLLIMSAGVMFGCSERQEQPAATPEPAAPPAAEVAEVTAADLDAGRELYERHCSSCHPNGGNIINRDKTLQLASLEASGLAEADAFVAYLRDPGPGMPAFSEDALPDEKAMQVAWYTLETFK
jgi:cytochrome c6